MNRNLLSICLLLVLASACSSIPVTETPSIAPAAIENLAPENADDELPPEILQETESSNSFGYTYQSPDGNRYVEGTGSIQADNFIDIPLDGIPIWLVSVPWNEGSLWVVADTEGKLSGYLISNGIVKNIDINRSSTEPGKPLIAIGQKGSNSPFASVLLGQADQSPISHGIPLLGINGSADISIEGNLRLFGDRENILISDALPDARLLGNGSDQLLFLSSPTTAYDHGVLGDAIEAESYTLVDLGEEPASFETFPIGNGQVVEGIAPIWTDWNGDGENEIIVTLSDLANGAQIVVFNEQGQRIAEGPAIGLGYRWRHQIAIAPFGPNGEMELVDVLTPHIGGVVEFYQWEADQLEIVASISGYTSHVIGSRNLDMAAAADFDGDGMVEVLLPSQDRTHLGAIQRVEGGAIVDWQLPLDGTLNSNLSVVRLPDGTLLLGAGLQDGRLRIWLP